ncbi:MAG: hypothetical protein KAY37_10235 [Phycisphaerae bacterium]|nr:hypothetical protein [Phycisphaerae bacterium]
MNTLTMLLAETADENVTLTTGGMVMMVFCVTLVLGLNIFCLTRILRPSDPSD